jgi:simple sugar transport system permease protein
LFVRTDPVVAPSKVGKCGLSVSTWLHYRAETFIIPAVALLASAAYFSVFLICLGKSPGEFFFLIARGGFGTLFSWQNTLVRAAPLILTALCVAIPARMGLVVIGGEGALVIAGFSAGAIAIPLDQSVAPMFITLTMGLTAVVVGACWIGLVGWLRHARGVNETISSLLLTYIAIAIVNFFIEGALRNPADPNRPSTKAINPDAMVGAIPGLHVHWGLATGVILAVLLYLLMDRTTFGFAARIAGGNPRVAEAQGLSVGRLIVTGCFIGGACAGLAGFFEVAAVHGRANAALHANYGFTGILVSFLARHSPLAIIPVACLFGGIGAAGGLIQRRMELPDATVLLLQGVVFVTLLASETLYGRLPFFRATQDSHT